MLRSGRLRIGFSCLAVLALLAFQAPSWARSGYRRISTDRVTVFSMPADEGASVLLSADDRKTQRNSNYTINSKFLPGMEQNYAAIMESATAGDSALQGVMLLYAESLILGGPTATPERRAQYRELGILMRQGTEVEDAVQSAFGKPFEQVEAEFADGHWRKGAQFRLALPDSPQTLPPAQKVDPAEADRLLSQLAERAQTGSNGH